MFLSLKMFMFLLRWINWWDLNKIFKCAHLHVVWKIAIMCKVNVASTRMLIFKKHGISYCRLLLRNDVLLVVQVTLATFAPAAISKFKSCLHFASLQLLYCLVHVCLQCTNGPCTCVTYTNLCDPSVFVFLLVGICECLSLETIK